MAMRPRRSVLYVPGDNEHALEKARTLAADSIIIDLEDSVSPANKEIARRHAISVIREGGFGTREAVLRVNPIETPWGMADLHAAIECGAGCHTHSEGFLSRRHHRHGQGRQGRRGSAEHSALGNDRNADGNHQCA